MHILPNLDQLPGPSHDSSEAEADDQSVVSDDDGDTTEVTRIECDRCNDLEKLDAVCFCVDCDKRLCKDHESVRIQLNIVKNNSKRKAGQLQFNIRSEFLVLKKMQ